MTTRRQAGSGLGRTLPAVAAAVAGMVLLAGLAARLPTPAEPVALVFAPGTTAAESLKAVAALDGLALRQGGAANVMVALFDRPLGWGELRAQGVWLALDPLFAGNCSAGDPPPSSPAPSSRDRTR